MDRDPHGNVQVSLIETEKLLVELVAKVLKEREATGTYKGKFSAQCHFFGYEGRCAAPSNFDADYCYSLGYAAAQLVRAGLTGYTVNVERLTEDSDQWTAGGVPVTMMLNMEIRKGKLTSVIRKALVDLNGKPFKSFAGNRDKWALGDEYVFPGPIQYFGPSEVCDRPTITLEMERS